MDNHLICHGPLFIAMQDTNTHGSQHVTPIHQAHNVQNALGEGAFQPSETIVFKFNKPDFVML